MSWPLLASAYPQACRSMCGCALNDSLATLPARSIIRAKPAVVWPQPRRDIELKWNAEAKDRLETVLCDLVCDGLVDIGDSQEAIITDWIAAYHLYNE